MEWSQGCEEALPKPAGAGAGAEASGTSARWEEGEKKNMVTVGGILDDGSHPAQAPARDK